MTMKMRRHILCLTILLLSVLGLWNVSAEQILCKEKLQAGHVAVVYSKNYQISLVGLENLHPFDIHKYAKIYKQLVKDNLFKAKDVYKPKPITKEDILLVHFQEFLDSLKKSQTVAKYLEAPMVKFFPFGIVDHCALRPFRYARRDSNQ